MSDVRPSPNAHLIGGRDSRMALATPALVLDLDALEKNVATMANLCAQRSFRIRPHAKTHKSARIAKLQQTAGAIGTSVASLREAQVMVESQVGGVLITSPLTHRAKIDGLMSLLDLDPTIMVVADNEANVRALEHRVKSLGKSLSVLVDIDVGMHRTGAASVSAASALARQIAASDVLRLAGLQCYSGMVQHVTDAAERTRQYRGELERVRAIVEELTKAGLPPAIISGGGTGTFYLDREDRLFTEGQAGSYVFMDVQYGDVQLFTDRANPFEAALFVQTSVISNNHAGTVTVDGGFKSFATDGPVPRPVGGAPATYQFYGDEFGVIRFADRAGTLELGSKVELFVPHCDPTVNLHDFYHCVRGQTLVDIWPVDARGTL